MSTYSGAQLKAQAGTLERYVGHLDLCEEEKASMRAVVPTGVATSTIRFKEVLARELVKADAAMPVKSDAMVQSCMHRAELESEARRRQVDLTKVGSPLAALKKAVLDSSRTSAAAGQVSSKKPSEPAAGDRVTRSASKAGTPRSVAVGEGNTTGDAGKKAKSRQRVQYEVEAVTGVRDAEGVFEYEVKWTACEGNGFDDDERTWEVEDCKAARGGLKQHIEAWWARQSGRKGVAEAAGEDSEDDDAIEIEDQDGPIKGNNKRVSNERGKGAGQPSSELESAVVVLTRAQAQLLQGQNEMREALQQLATK